MATAEILQELIRSPDRLQAVVEEAKMLAFEKGILMRTRDAPNSSEVVTFQPFTLLPSPVPKAAYLQALRVQTHLNTLMDKISQDAEFLEEALAGCVQVDDYTAKLFGIFKQVQKEGRTQSIVVSLNRSDYMLDQSEDGSASLKQIEVNTFSVAGFGATDRLPEVHRKILTAVGLAAESEFIMDAKRTSGMCDGLAKGWELYGREKAVVLFLVEDVQISRLSHRVLEEELWSRNIPVIRRKFSDVSRGGSLDESKRLFIDGQEVVVVYYRNGYMPQHYTQQWWEARLLMERSLAVKCPDISTHLGGTKKVQQVLARPGVLERFFPNQPQVVEQIRATFTGLYSLDMGPEGDQAVEAALATPDRFVLKPQREGGGNNLYGDELHRVLQALRSSPERMAYILMDKLRPSPVQNILLKRDFPLQVSDCVGELGVFGVFVRHGEETVMNECVGHLLKTRSAQHDEGGISSGAGVSDSPLLV
ncbi:glutathione synthetase-like isoform X1 [Nelusetta ayraudi]|uniref:glutathione synthetase-like isoform X1 n=1 Tax=Nelusetta ayraudi TaxID=303726 RepID=UPI003F710705